MPVTCRARLVSLSALLFAALALPGALAADDEPKPFFTVREVGPGVFAAVAVAGSGAGSNAGFVIGESGVAVIDTFQSAAAAESLLEAIRERTDLPVRFVVNTHYHVDHVAGNGVFREAGAAIVAQSNVRAWELTENLKWFGDEVPAEQQAWIESLLLPELVYEDGIDLYLGSLRLAVRVWPGHTGGDSIVLVPSAGVVFTGDLFWNATLPNTTDADTAAWVATDASLAADHPEATFVPGHGEVGKAGDLQAFRGYLEALRAGVAAAREKGLTGDGLVAAVHGELAPRYEEWALFGHFIDQNIAQAESELAGTKRRPVPAQ